MATEVVMPKLGLTMTEGTINRWLKQEGEQVEKDEPLLEVSTEKVVTEVEASASGILGKIIVPEGGTVEVATPIAFITAPGEEIPKTAVPAYAASSCAERRPNQASEEAPEPLVQLPLAKSRVKASPKAKKMAGERGIDLSLLKGSGPGGRIIAKDIGQYIPPSAPAPEPAPAPAPVPELVSAPSPWGDEVIEIKGIRKVIAERMTQSFTEKPHVTLNVRVDVSELQKLRRKINTHLQGDGASGAEISKISFNDLLLKLTALSLTRHRNMNAIIEGNRIVRRGEINIGLAVALDEGLIVPVVRSADRRSLKEIAVETKDLVKRARENLLTQDEFQGGTFTLSNLGMFGVENFTPIVNPPEVAILGVGQINRVPLVEENEIIIKPVIYLSLSFDHRATDGAQAAIFLKTLKDLIEEPQLIWLL